MGKSCSVISGLLLLPRLNGHSERRIWEGLHLTWPQSRSVASLKLPATSMPWELWSTNGSVESDHSKEPCGIFSTNIDLSNLPHYARSCQISPQWSRKLFSKHLPKIHKNALRVSRTLPQLSNRPYMLKSLLLLSL